MDRARSSGRTRKCWGTPRAACCGRARGLSGLLLHRGGGVWVLTETALHHWQEGIKRTLAAPERRVFRWMHEDTRGRLYAYAEGELERRFYRWQDGEWRIVPIKDNRGRFYDDYWLCATSDAVGHLWIGGRSGLILSDGEGWYLSREVRRSARQPDRGADTPYGMICCLAFAPNGDLWAGTPGRRICRLRDGRWSYFWGKRWLPDNRVYAIAVDPRTAHGSPLKAVSPASRSVPMTLRQKAEHYEKLIALRHNRNGFRGSAAYGKTPASPTSGKSRRAITTGCGLRSIAPRSASSTPRQKTRARQRARQSMQALLHWRRSRAFLLSARSIIHKSETRYIQSLGEWHESPVDPNYIWKGDTSASDELDGHYFIWAIYYDLVADEAEKEAIQGRGAPRDRPPDAKQLAPD